MSEIPDKPPPSLLHVSPMERVKRAPWVDIGLVAGAVALTIIGGLAHFGGLLFLEAGQRITRNYLRKQQIQPVVLGSTELAEYSYKGNGYTVKGKIPKQYHEEIPEALKRATEAADRRVIPLKRAIEEEMDGLGLDEGSIFVWAEEKKIFSGEYRGGWRLRFDEEQPPLTILGSFPDYDGEILTNLSRAEQTEKEIEKVLDAYFKSHWASGKIKVKFGNQVLIREYDELGRPVKRPLPSAISQGFDYYIYGIDKHVYFYGLPDQIIKRRDFMIYPKRVSTN
jgi:hypothetical protein